ncbi:energy transducer TonB [Sphingobium yanoikuyae]|uniref:Energy transducer TonB n=1 Tax=Sphingobium yanoikuyae TaxID=13690 RepID=A0AA42WYZ4_SPHYA|nr:energy transducer TonB [Sphingobium yanoikuyae]MDH2132966.1 energy transducer TonB [Sphingobium yanoikuyae]MDH2152942.1 energy transducer TonB [Sphingobium yanoikuyae]MDH2168226.1 energy transducer TonB [Sphingobium yanoikuyae]
MMGIVSVLIHAVALVNATPANYPGDWVTSLDYPTDDKRPQGEGTTFFALLIAPNGQAIRCDITQSSGSTALDRKTCALILARAKFTHATDETGSAIHSQWHSRVRWWRSNGQGKAGSERSAAPPVDLGLQVSNLPDGARETTASIVVKVDTSGHVSHCQGVKPDEAKLVDVACTQASALTLEAGKDNEGQAIPFVRAMLVGFRVSPQ